MSFLHEHIITGPIRSRRLGSSLGVNLLPTHHKFCNFNCVYCECGWGSPQETLESIPNRHQVAAALKFSFKKCRDEDILVDSITFSGNGESTLHPNFAGIIDDTVSLRDHYLPKSKITIISNSTQIDQNETVLALKKVDTLLLKLDAGTPQGFNHINQPMQPMQLEDIICKMKKINFPFWIQTLFFKGEVNGIKIDNTQGDEFENWLKSVAEIHPEGVMIYGLDRETPAKNLIKLSQEELEIIAQKVRNIGVTAHTYF